MPNALWTKAPTVYAVRQDSQCLRLHLEAEAPFQVSLRLTSPNGEWVWESDWGPCAESEANVEFEIVDWPMDTTFLLVCIHGPEGNALAAQTQWIPAPFHAPHPAEFHLESQDKMAL